ncbi:MAG: copper resistance protein B [Pseudomonadota bacterium]
MRRAAVMTMLLWSSAAFAAERNPTGAPADWPTPMMGDQPYGAVFLDRLEYGDSDEDETILWDAQAWYGGDYNKVWLETEGEGPTGETPEAELQLLFDRAFSPFWSWRAGVRYDARPHGEDDTAYAALGIQGLAPQWFETDVALFVSEDGDVSLNGEAEYEVLITQRLILQPRLEVAVSGSDVPELGLGSGVTSTEAGLRLRYEIRRELAPYAGVRWERLYGDTRELARGEGEPTSVTSFVVGIRAWF